MLNRTLRLANSLRDLGKQAIESAVAGAQEPFFEAVIAAGYMTARANHTIDEREKAKLQELIASETGLSQLGKADFDRVWDAIHSKFELDNSLGEKFAWEKIMQISNSEERALLCVLFAAAVGRADGYFDPTQKVVVRKIAEQLFVDISNIKDLND